MIFSATHACARCRLRFARRASCPSCGGNEIFALDTPNGRARYRAAAAARRPVGGGAGLLQRLLAWASAQLRGLLGLRLLPPAAPAPPTRMRVYSPTDADGDATTLTGIARRASVEIESLLSGEPCLLFGLRGTVGDADVADADGGDFDLELPSGERVMISLEHAVLVVDAADSPPPATEIDLAIGSPLANLLEGRGILDDEGTASLEELLVRAGDEVTVTGEPLGGTVTSFGQGTAGRTRVLAGTEEHPLSVRVRRSP